MYQACKQIFLALLLFRVFTLQAENEPACFTAFIANPATALLPDYSYAGYKFGVDSIPTTNLPIFDVTKYGAIPNDNLEDFDGVQAAIDAAAAAGGGIVFFPKGRFLMNEMVGRTDGIHIPKLNIILRGSGSGAGGTELFMRNYMLPTDPNQMWSVPSLFHFYYYQSSPVRTKIALNALRGDKQITVDNVSTLKAGDMIEFRMTNPVANNELLSGLTPYPEWTTTINNGITINEKHKISGIQGNIITLSEPININITASYGWNVVYLPLSEGLGVEDIWFHGNFKDKIVHHKDFINDAGWSFIRLERFKDAFIRRLRFTDMNAGIAVVNGYGCSVMHIRFDGNPGHFCVEASGGTYGVLMGFIDDATNSPGFFHGPGPSATSSATVVWRYRGQSRSGFDVHASYPYYTLFDVSKSRYIGNGGDAAVCPNHGKDLTYWNHTENGSSPNIAFWEDHVNPPYGNYPKIVKPNIIGWQGNSTFLKSTLGIFENYQQAVTPESLYEAQLTLRLGTLPEWVNAAKKEWYRYLLKKEWTSVLNNGSNDSTNYVLNVSASPDWNGFYIFGDCIHAKYSVFNSMGRPLFNGIVTDYLQFVPVSAIQHAVCIIVFEINAKKIIRKLIL